MRPHLVSMLIAVTALSTLAPRSAEAQAQGAASATQRRQSASDAYDRGTSEYLQGNYEKAAEWFETADRLVPAAPALIQAIRAHQKAGNTLRAATLTLRLRSLYPSDRAAAQLARPILRKASKTYARVNVSCTYCTVELDGKEQDYPAFYVEAKHVHRVRALFERGAQEQKVSGEAGETIEVRFEEPSAASHVANSLGETPDTKESTLAESTSTAPAEAVESKPRSRSRKLAPWVAWTGIAITGGLLAFTIWSGVDTLSGVDRYEAMPTPESLQDGEAKERRTNIGIAITSVVGATTLGIALFATDWRGENKKGHVRASVRGAPGGGAAVVEGRF